MGVEISLMVVHLTFSPKRSTNDSTSHVMIPKRRMVGGVVQQYPQQALRNAITNTH